MKFPQPIPVKEIAQKINAKLIGDDTLEATGINEIHKVQKGDITFVDVKKYFERSLHSEASIIILNAKADCPPGKALLICDDPFHAYDGLVREYRPFRPLTQNNHSEASIHPSTVIEPNVTIGHDVTIGKNCYIQSNVYIGDYTVIGDNVKIQAGTIIGTDAFYFKRQNYGYEKWRTGGRVILEDGVDIGAACTINKGVSGNTIIGSGTKIDCHVHIGHGVEIGKNCLFAAQVGIGGKTIIGDWVVLYGQVGIAQSLKIGDKAVVLAKSGVSKNLEGGKTYFGSPATEARSMYRELAALRHLPDFFSKYYQ